MNEKAIRIARIYITEGDKLLNAIMNYLHIEIKVRGVTVFRAISGFGESGALHTTDLLTASLNLPLVVEFFDDVDKVSIAITHLSSLVGPEHIISWMANAY